MGTMKHYNGHRSFLLLATVMAMSAVSGVSVAAEGCSTYPLADGISIEATEAGPKIMSTASVTVSLDDRAEVLDALKEAGLIATAQIAQFMSETIQSEQSLETAVATSIQIIGDERTVTKDTVKTQLTRIRTSAGALLKGVMKIGDCYSKGDFVMLTVGLKPETIGAASELKDKMASDSAIDGVDSSSTIGIDGYSNSEGVTKF